MDQRSQVPLTERLIAVLLRGVAITLAVAGLLAALGSWSIMATYPDEQPNSLVHNFAPLLVYAVPAWSVALGLLWLARRVETSAQGRRGKFRF
jgi:hypothetical protein